MFCSWCGLRGVHTDDGDDNAHVLGDDGTGGNSLVHIHRRLFDDDVTSILPYLQGNSK